MQETPPLSKEELALFYDVSTSIHAIQDLDDMLKNILEKIRDVLNAEGASLALHDADRKEFYFIRSVELEKDGDYEKMIMMRIPDHLGIAGCVLKENRPIIIPDVSKDDRVFKDLNIKGGFVTRSMICLPLHTRKGFLGVLYVLNKLKGEFAAREERLLEILSGTIAIAIENGQFYGQLKRYADSLEEENRRLKSEMWSRFDKHGIIASSPAMRRLFFLVDKVKDTTTAVLIQGETGTGKELIARVIHYGGPLKERPFVAENCGAMSENLLESELFGHVKGAFTGAVTDKKGLFEMADGGTLFLDEIGEMPPSMQVKLLRVLQDGRVRPVGGSEYRNVDVRLIACTNRNLEDEVKNGNFRDDLFYRIHVFPITVPPLRERRGDIPLLAAHFFKKFAKKQKRPVPRLSPGALDLLTRYDWPGNVRELENEIERVLTIIEGEVEITEDYLSDRINRLPENDILIHDDAGTLKEVTELIEKKMVIKALQKTHGNRSQASRVLGLTRQGLINKVARYDIKI